MSPRVARVVVLAALFAAPLVARAQGAEERAIAERLFLEGRALMEQKEYERACAKFDESYRRDLTAMGTLLNLALCHEQVGRVASAWSEFRIVAAGSRLKREDRVKLAEEHAARLMKALSYLTVTTPRGVPGVVVTLDGVALGAAALDTEIPVDPGERTIEATAPGKLAWRTRVVVGNAADKKAVAIPLLEDAPAAAPPSAPVPALVPAPAAPPHDDASIDAIAAARARRIIGFTVAGVGLAVVGVGTFLGVRAIEKYSDAKRQCPGDVCATAGDLGTARGLVDDAKTGARLANVAIGLGAAAIVGGVLLVLLSGPTSASASPRAAVGPGGIGVAF